MTKEKKNTKKTDGGIFRVFELITESIGWLQMLASPFLIGLIVGVIIYFSNSTTTSLILGIIVATFGLTIGVIWATRQWKGKGTIWFMSGIMATPDLDNPDNENKPKSKNTQEHKVNR